MARLSAAALLCPLLFTLVTVVLLRGGYGGGHIVTAQSYRRSSQYQKKFSPVLEVDVLHAMSANRRNSREQRQNDYQYNQRQQRQQRQQRLQRQGKRRARYAARAKLFRRTDESIPSRDSERRSAASSAATASDGASSYSSHASSSSSSSSTSSKISSWPPSHYSLITDKKVTINGRLYNPDIAMNLRPTKYILSKRKKLLLLLGKGRRNSLNADWLSIERPQKLYEHISVAQQLQQQQLSSVYSSSPINPDLQTELERLASQFNFTVRDKSGVLLGMPRDQWPLFRRWLVHSAMCPHAYMWESLGTMHWPKWIRRLVCPEHSSSATISTTQSSSSSSSSSYSSSASAFSASAPNQAPSSPSSCSWPPGMKCKKVGKLTLNLLVWSCELDETGERARWLRKQQARLKRRIRWIKKRRLKRKYPRLITQITTTRRRQRRDILKHRLNRLYRRIKIGRKLRTMRLRYKLSMIKNKHVCKWMPIQFKVPDKCKCMCSQSIT